MQKVRAKVTLEFDMEMDDHDPVYKFSPEGIMREIIFDEVTNYLVTRHLQEAVEWLVKSKETKDDKKSMEYQIYQRHKLWSDILKNASRNIEFTYPK